MKTRVISLLLAAVMLLTLLPMPTLAADAKADAIQTQIRKTYRKALYRTGKSTFNGYCGSLVSWQTYLLGIDKTVYGCDGKNQFDMYRNLGETTGGYRVRSYPASQYTLQEALNQITANGTVDAYNILVGFQRTNTQEGRIYGHAVLIHAILDGVVYFAECYSTSLDGKYWGEGTPISCSIDTFCDYYNSWTVFDGIAYFGVKNYAELCQTTPLVMYAIAAGDLVVYREPSDPGVYDGQSTEKTLAAGEIVKTVALLKTPAGGYWYQLEDNSAYVKAEGLIDFAQCSFDAAGGLLYAQHLKGNNVYYVVYDRMAVKDGMDSTWRLLLA